MKIQVKHSWVWLIYAPSAVYIHGSNFGVVKEQEIPFTSASVLTSEGFNESGHLPGCSAGLHRHFLMAGEAITPGFIIVRYKLHRGHHQMVSKLWLAFNWKDSFDMSNQLMAYVCGKKFFLQKFHLLFEHLLCFGFGRGHITCKSHSGIFVCLISEDESMFHSHGLQNGRQQSLGQLRKLN